MSIDEVKRKHSAQLRALDGVNGVGVEESADGVEYLKVMVVRLTPELEARIPREIEGYRVEIEEVGDIYAL